MIMHYIQVLALTGVETCALPERLSAVWLLHMHHRHTCHKHKSLLRLELVVAQYPNRDMTSHY